MGGWVERWAGLNGKKSRPPFIVQCGYACMGGWVERWAGLNGKKGPPPCIVQCGYAYMGVGMKGGWG